MATHSFGPHTLSEREVFASSPLSLGFVNLKPVVPGHVLFIPRRVCARLSELTAEELADLWRLASACGPLLERHFGASALTFAVQDGAAAGQTVPHCHIHLLPRKGGDFAQNDQVYDAIDASERSLSRDLDKERVARSSEEMAAEAQALRALLVSHRGSYTF